MNIKEKIFCRECKYYCYGDCHSKPKTMYDPIDGEMYTYKQCKIKNKNMDCKEHKYKGFWGNL